MSANTPSKSETTACARVVAECKRGAQVDLPGLLEWMADRLVYVYGENPNIDFVLTTRERAKGLRLALDIYDAECKQP